MGRSDTRRIASTRISSQDILALVAFLSGLAFGGECRGPRQSAAPRDAGGRAAPAPEAGAPPTPARQVLQTLAAPPYAYELSLENCTDQARANIKDPSVCVFAVRLLEGPRAVDRFTLRQQGCGPASPTTVDRTLGADRDAKAFSTSDEGCEIDAAVRTVQLGANVTALLVTEQQGFEYRHRQHALLVARRGKLETLWSYDDDDLGMHWTTTTVVPAAAPREPAAGAQDIAVVDTERTIDGVTARVRATRLHLDPATGTLGQQALPDAAVPLLVLVVGSFKTAAETAAARQHCVHDLIVMRAALFPRLRLPAFFLGAVFVRRDDAEDRLAELASCPKTKANLTKGTILESGISGGKSHGGHH